MQCISAAPASRPEAVVLSVKAAELPPLLPGDGCLQLLTHRATPACGSEPPSLSLSPATAWTGSIPFTAA